MYNLSLDAYYYLDYARSVFLYQDKDFENLLSSSLSPMTHS